MIRTSFCLFEILQVLQPHQVRVYERVPVVLGSFDIAGRHGFDYHAPGMFFEKGAEFVGFLGYECLWNSQPKLGGNS